MAIDTVPLAGGHSICSISFGLPEMLSPPRDGISFAVTVVAVQRLEIGDKIMKNINRLLPALRSLSNRTVLLWCLSTVFCAFTQVSCGSDAGANVSTCTGLAETACQSSAECTSVTASTLDETSCVSSDTFIECRVSTSPSCQWGSSFRDPDGRCWTTGGCPSKLPVGWQIDISCGNEYATARVTCAGGHVDSGEPEADGGIDSSSTKDS